MARKKDRHVYNIDKVNVEIDYDKLAEAITKANKVDANAHSISAEWMKFIITPVFWGVAIASGLLAMALLIYSFREMPGQYSAAQTYWQQFSVSIFTFGLGLFLASVSIFTVFAAREIDRETDRQYVASMFSNIVALVALAVSLIALVKG